MPQDNGEVERQNRSLLECLQVARREKKNWRSELISWVTPYRCATPFSLMFGQEMRTKHPELRGETRFQRSNASKTGPTS